LTGFPGEDEMSQPDGEGFHDDHESDHVHFRPGRRPRRPRGSGQRIIFKWNFFSFLLLKILDFC